MALDPVTMGIGAGLSGLSSLGSMIAGGIQMRRGKKDLAEAERTRPTYERPAEANEMESISRMRAANPFLPGQSLMEQQVEQTSAKTAQNISEMGGVADLYAVQMGENQAMNQIAIQSSQQALQNELNLLKQLQMSADYTDQEFDYNVNIPWQEKRKSALDRIGAGQTNIGQALSTLSTMGASMIGMPKKTDGSSEKITEKATESASKFGKKASETANLFSGFINMFK